MRPSIRPKRSWRKFRNFMLRDPLHETLQDVVWSNSYVTARTISEHSRHLDEQITMLGGIVSTDDKLIFERLEAIKQQLVTIRTIMDVWTQMTLTDVVHKIDHGFQLMDKNQQMTLGTVLDAETRLADRLASLQTALLPSVDSTPAQLQPSTLIYKNGPADQPWRESIVNQVRVEGAPAFIKLYDDPVQLVQDFVFDLDELSVNDIFMFRVEMKLWRPCNDPDCILTPCPKPRQSWSQSELYKVQMQTPTSKSRMQIVVNDQPIGPTKMFSITPLQGPWDIRLTMAQIGGTNAPVRWFTTKPPTLATQC